MLLETMKRRLEVREIWFCRRLLKTICTEQVRNGHVKLLVFFNNERKRNGTMVSKVSAAVKREKT